MHAILCFGDSITFGAGDIENRGWCGRLRKGYESEEHRYVYNLGICGDTSTTLLARIDVEARARARRTRDDDRSCILIAIGTNDSRINGAEPETPIEDFSKNIDAILTIAERYGHTGVIGLTGVDEALALGYEGTSFSNERLCAYNEVLRGAAQKHSVPFLDLHDAFLAEPYHEMLDDGLHPNAKGYEWMYERISSFLIENKLIEAGELRAS